MKIEKIKNSQNLKGYILFIISLLLIFLSSYLFYKSYALYEEQKDFNVINGTVEEAGDIYFAYYINGIISRNIPVQNTGYTLDVEKSNCNNGVIPSWDNAGWKFVGDYHNYNATDNTRTKCTLYFNKTAKTVKTALGNIEVNSYTPDFAKSACDDSSCESHEKGIYETTDTDGNPTYYYRGSVENNYVKFAGYYWRIIRINSNGSIRMIYDGTSAHANGESSADRRYGTSKFNAETTSVSYVGYMYTENNLSGTEISSKLKESIDKFYVEKIINYENYIDKSAGFCGDRSILNNDSDDENLTYFKSYSRFLSGKPSLICENTIDYYTVKTAALGNKALIYPIGTITMDECLYSGFSSNFYYPGNFSFKWNTSVFLFAGNDDWTMTPTGYFNPGGWGRKYTMVFKILPRGAINPIDVGYNYGLRPVINIRSDVKIIGSGTQNDPYVVN